MSRTHACALSWHLQLSLASPAESGMTIILERLCIIQLKPYAREINHICNNSIECRRRGERMVDGIVVVIVMSKGIGGAPAIYRLYSTGYLYKQQSPPVCFRTVNFEGHFAQVNSDLAESLSPEYWITVLHHREALTKNKVLHSLIGFFSTAKELIAQWQFQMSSGDMVDKILHHSNQ